MMHIYRFCLLLIFVVPSYLFGQDQRVIDSLEQKIKSVPDSVKCQIYMELYRMTFNQDLDRAEVYARACSAVADRSDYLPTIALSQKLLGIHFLQVSDYPGARENFINAIENFEKINNQKQVLATTNNLALVYEGMGNYEKALENHFTFYRLADSLEMGDYFLGSSMWNIGNIQNNLLKFEESIEWFTKAKNIFLEIGDSLDIVDLDHQIALAYSDLGNYPEAETLFLECIDYYRKEGFDVALAGALDNLGKVYIDQKRYVMADEVLQEALKTALSTKAGFLPGQIYRRLTELSIATDQLVEAKKYGQLSLQNAQAYKRDKKMITDFLLLSQIHEKEGSYPAALNYYKQYFAQTDSIFGLEKLNALNDLQLEYQAYLNQKEVQLLEEKNRVAQLKQNGLIGGIIGLIAIFGALLFALKQRLNKNKIAREKAEQEISFQQKELELQHKELTAYALQLAQKNEVLEGLKSAVSKVKGSDTRQVQKIINTIHFNQQDDHSWEGFRQRFVALHKDFEPIIKSEYPEVTPNELRLMSLIKMNLSSKEIANILSVSSDGIKKARYRLRKKLGMDTSESLEDFILQI